MALEAVLFDLDDTLFDRRKAQGEMLPLILREFGGEWATLANPKNMSLPAFIYRLLPAGVGPQVARAAALAASAAVILLTVWWMHRHRHRLTTAACLAAAVPVALLVCPVTWMHHGVQLLIPLAVMAVATMRQPRLHALDATWLVLTLLLYTNWPVERFALDLSPRLMHLTSPTLMYATGLAWLFMVLRYVPLTRRLTASAAQPSVPEAPAEFKPMGVTP